MGRGFSDKTKISKHNRSYSIHPDKRIVDSMGWKLGDELKVIPIPDKGVICLKGKKTTNDKFTKKFYRETLKNSNKKEVERIHNKLKSTLLKFAPLDIIAYKKAFKKILDLEKSIKKILDNWDIFIMKEEKKIRKKLDIPFTKEVINKPSSS